MAPVSIGTSPESSSTVPGAAGQAGFGLEQGVAGPELRILHHCLRAGAGQVRLDLVGGVSDDHRQGGRLE